MECFLATWEAYHFLQNPPAGTYRFAFGFRKTLACCNCSNHDHTGHIPDSSKWQLFGLFLSIGISCGVVEKRRKCKEKSHQVTSRQISPFSSVIAC